MNKINWIKQLSKIAIIVMVMCSVNVQGQNKVIVDMNAKGEPFTHFWSKCVGAWKNQWT